MTEAKKVEINKDELPEGWVASTLGDIASYIQRGKSPKYTKFSELPVVNQKCVRWHGIDREHIKYIHPDQFERWEEKRFLQNGDLLWNSTGTGTIGRAAIVHLKEGEKLVADSHVTIVRSGEGIEAKYVHYWVMSPAVQNSIEAMQSGSTNQVELSKGAVESTPIPVAPPEQQKRIVAKIEELFSHIDAGIAALKKAKQLLKQYRQSVLKAAVTGELTKEWREANKGKLDTSIQLRTKLQESKIEHNKDLLNRWEKAKEQWKLEGEIGKRPGKPKIIDSLEEIDEEIIQELPRIPDEWCWILIGDVSDAIDPQPSHRTPPVVEGGIPYIGIGDIDKANGKIDFENARQVSPYVLVEHKIRYDLKEGDFIIGKIGTIGKPFQIPAKRFYTLSANVVLVRPIDGLANPNYLFNLCKSPVIEHQFESGSKATTQAAFGIKKVRLLAAPYCSMAEQEEIVKNLEDCLTRASRLEDELDRQVKKAEKNKQSVLASGFSGKLS